MLKINELPASEQPRNKLRMNGAQSLSNAELLTILLSLSSVSEGEQIMREIESLKFAGQAEVKGSISPVASAKLKAFEELAKRRGTPPVKLRFSSPEVIADIFIPELRHETKEHLYIVCLNKKSEYIGKHEISIGGMSMAIVEQAQVFKSAILAGAAAIILVHNHPSGDPSPSEDDLILTSQNVKAGKLMGVPVVDHLIIGNGCFKSLKRENLMDADIAQTIDEKMRWAKQNGKAVLDLRNSVKEPVMTFSELYKKYIVAERFDKVAMKSYCEIDSYAEDHENARYDVTTYEFDTLKEAQQFCESMNAAAKKKNINITQTKKEPARSTKQNENGISNLLRTYGKEKKIRER
jgi:DNA repair protein RadC